MRKMRRSDKQMTEMEAKDLLVRGEYGILSTIDDSKQPYGTPLSYVYSDGKIYFHSAMEGQKLDNLIDNGRVCFTVVGRTNVLPEKFSTEYESVMVFGHAKLVGDDDEKKFALRELIKKYSAGFIAEGDEYINRAKNNTMVVKIDLSKITGKRG